MMSVKEYALDINKTIEEVIKKANELGYVVNNEEDMLSEDAIIDLDTVLTMNTDNNEDENVYLEEDTLDKDYDLDEDGVDELLIGFNDGSTATKFTDVLVWHSDLGAYKLLGGGSGYYIYLCAGNVLAVDSWYGSQTERTFMTWNSKTNSFPHVDGEGKYLPMKWDLTEF